MHIREVHDLFQLQLRANGRSQHTRDQYARHVRMLEAWLTAEGSSLDIRDVDHIAVAQFLCSPVALEKRGGGARKATSANGIRSSLRCFFAWAHSAGYAPRNAAALVQRARCAGPPPRALSEDDQRRLLSVLAQATDPEGRRDHALFATMLGTGIRVASAVALDVRDVDLERGEFRLRTTKGDRPAQVLVPRAVVSVLRTYLAGRTDGPLFQGRRGARITARHVARRLALWLRGAGVERRASPHSLRHSFAMRVYGKTGDLLLTQAALGHASVASTAMYARADNERLRAAIGT